MKITIEISAPPNGWEYQSRRPNLVVRNGSVTSEDVDFICFVDGEWKILDIESAARNKNILAYAYKQECLIEKWQHDIKEWAKKHDLNKGYVAVDASGEIYFYKERPYRNEYCRWESHDNDNIWIKTLDTLISEPPQCQCNWEDSLVEIGGDE